MGLPQRTQGSYIELGNGCTTAHGTFQSIPKSVGRSLGNLGRNWGFCWGGGLRMSKQMAEEELFREAFFGVVDEFEEDDGEGALNEAIDGRGGSLG